MEVEDRGRALYSISAVGHMVGLPVATLRTWEDRYALVVPDRNASGHRLYSRDQVEQLRFIRTRMAQGLGVADAHRLLAEQLGAGLPVTTQASRAGFSSCSSSLTPTPPSIRSIS